MNKLNRHSDNYRELMLLKIDIKLRHGFRHFAFFLKWLAIAAFLGVVCGLTGALFHYFIDEAAYLFGEYGFLLRRPDSSPSFLTTVWISATTKEPIRSSEPPGRKIPPLFA